MKSAGKLTFLRFEVLRFKDRVIRDSVQLYYDIISIWDFAMTKNIRLRFENTIFARLSEVGVLRETISSV